MIKILALDLSLTNAGVCRLLDYPAGQPQFVVETVKTPRVGTPKKQIVGTARLLWWKQWLGQELTLSDYSLVVMEAPAINAPGHKYSKGELYGVIKVACKERGICLLTASIQSIKLFATGSGQADKQRMIDMAVDAFGPQIKDEHQADAAWLCKLALAYDLGEYTGKGMVEDK